MWRVTKAVEDISLYYTFIKHLSYYRIILFFIWETKVPCSFQTKTQFVQWIKHWSSRLKNGNRAKTLLAGNPNKSKTQIYVCSSKKTKCTCDGSLTPGWLNLRPRAIVEVWKLQSQLGEIQKSPTMQFHTSPPGFRSPSFHGVSYNYNCILYFLLAAHKWCS